MIEVVKVGDVARIDVRFLLRKECIVEDLVVVLVSDLVGGCQSGRQHTKSAILFPSSHISKAFSHCILPLQPTFHRHFSNAYLP